MHNRAANYNLLYMQIGLWSIRVKVRIHKSEELIKIPFNIEDGGKDHRVAVGGEVPGASFAARGFREGASVKVNWNEMGQPIGKESTTLAHFVGNYARRNLPIICDDWRKDEWKNVKQTLWDEIKMKDKINSSVKNPIVTRLDAWEYARRDADGEVSDPATLQVLEDVVAIAQSLPEHELTNIGTDDLLARAILLEYAGRVRSLGWGVTNTSLKTTSTASELSKLKNDVSYLMNEINEMKRKGCNPVAQPGGSVFRSHSGKRYSAMMFHSFRWSKVQCPKQTMKDSTYSGHFVGSFIEDLLCAGATKIDANFTYTPRLKTYPLNKMVHFEKNWGGYLYNRHLKGKLLMK
ncbi:hypothetical protein DCAR_0101568 [Daucus carota subsp. sativus]|uniref:Uncharacterized protein n=1 Tax=Daucus carota subsp. sativus TaxID=79200 RepID=A0A166GG60_DAUCS|nr:hypothetical protein DCAR_0101568 [Daucus carota subsp. sativus]